MSLTPALRNMPFREKTAWAMAVILTGGAAAYFIMVVSASRALGQTAPPIIGFVIGYVVLVVIASLILLTALAATSPREANAPADEREKIIGDQAGNWSGYVMVVPAIGALWHNSFNGDGNMLLHLVFFSLMLGQIAEYVLQIIFYRLDV